MRGFVFFRCGIGTVRLLVGPFNYLFRPHILCRISSMIWYWCCVPQPVHKPLQNMWLLCSFSLFAFVPNRIVPWMRDVQMDACDICVRLCLCMCMLLMNYLTPFAHITSIDMNTKSNKQKGWIDFLLCSIRFLRWVPVLSFVCIVLSLGHSFTFYLPLYLSLIHFSTLLSTRIWVWDESDLFRLSQGNKPKTHHQQFILQYANHTGGAARARVD